MKNQFIEQYFQIKDNLSQYQCIRAIQLVTLLVGGLSFFIHHESVLIAFMAYFWLEVTLIKYTPIQDMQSLIDDAINTDATLLQKKAEFVVEAN